MNTFLQSLRVIAFVTFILILQRPVTADAQSSADRRSENLATCLSGRYPSLCDHSLLTPVELQQVQEAERLENLRVCLSGRYPTLCNHSLLRPMELKQVQEAERGENLRTCLTGRYPSLCNKAVLSLDELKRTVEAERLENLRTCLTGRYPTLCNHSLLSKAEAEQVADAERLAASRRASGGGSTAVRRSTSGSGDCESGHWIESVSDDGDIIKLEDGSIWEVDAIDVIYSALWLPTTEVLVCSGRIINVDDNEKVSATKLK